MTTIGKDNHPFDAPPERLLADLTDLRNKIFAARHTESWLVRLNSYQQARLLERYLDLQIEKVRGVVALQALMGEGGGSNADPS